MKAINVKCLATTVALVSILMILFFPIVYSMVIGRAYIFMDGVLQLLLIVFGMGCLVYSAQVMTECEIKS